MEKPPTSPGQGGCRRRALPWLVTVEDVVRLTPRMTRVIFGGAEFAGFRSPCPAAHIKLLFVPPGTEWSPKDEQAPRPPSRRFTPLRFDPENRRLEVEFVHHGQGLVAIWAAEARVGDELYIGGPGGGYDIAPDATDVIIVDDDTAIPAPATILEALPRVCRATALYEVADAAEESALSPGSTVTPIWLHRNGQVGLPGATLEDAVRVSRRLRTRPIGGLLARLPR